MLFDIAMLVAGLVLLVFAGDYLVKGAVGLAENLGIPALIIGLTIAAFGTSAPELFVALQSALTGVPDIATGNVVGSNIANVLLVMGLPALFSPIHANQRGLSRNVAVMLAFTVAFMWLISDGMLSRLEAMGLFGGLIVFIVAQGIRARQAIAEADEEEVPGDYHDEIGEAPHSPAMIAVFLIGGIIGLPVAAHFTVSGASGIATAFGVSEAAIGLTIAAIERRCRSWPRRFRRPCARKRMWRSATSSARTSSTSQRSWASPAWSSPCPSRRTSSSATTG